MDKITVVTIVRNDVRGIGATIESVVGQSARDRIEYIVIDGASTDGTVDVIRSYSDDIDVLVSEPDRGIYDAMNKGLNKAAGRYVVFMNSGDRFASNEVVSDIIEAIKSSGREPAVVYGTYREVDGEGHRSGVVPCRKPQRIWYGPVASHQSTFYHLDTLHRLDISYDTTYRIAADYRLTLGVLYATGFDGMPTDVCVSLFDITGASNANQDLGLAEANRARREVLGWGSMRCQLMKMLLLTARMAKRNLGSFYRLLRRHI